MSNNKMSAEEIKQTLSEFDAYFNHFSQIEPKEEGYKDAGHTWIAFTDKWERWKKELLAYASTDPTASSAADSMRVSMTKDDIIDFAKKLIFSYENSGNPAGELIPDCDALINNLFKPLP